MGQTCLQAGIFVLGWCAYASTYLLRKPVSVIKVDLGSDFHFTENDLGMFDLAILLPYSVIQMVYGSVGDVWGPRHVFGFSLIIAALSMVSFGYWNSKALFILLLAVSGGAQSLCWPCCTKILHQWFNEGKHNTMFGLLSTSAFAGGSIGTMAAVYLQSLYGWRFVFLPLCAIVFIFGVLILIFFREMPQPKCTFQDTRSDKILGQPNALAISLWNIPTVADISIAMFCIKLVRYSLSLWLPLFLLDHLHYSKAQSGTLSVSFELGGVLGCVILSILIDKYFQRRPLLALSVMLALSGGAILLLNIASHQGALAIMALLAVAGATNCVADSVLGGSLPSELGERHGQAGAAVTGLVNGFGSLGAVVEGPLIGWLSHRAGWSHVILALVGVSLLGALALVRADLVHSRMVRIS